jgi:hypothetical protein
MSTDRGSVRRSRHRLRSTRPRVVPLLSCDFLQRWTRAHLRLGLPQEQRGGGRRWAPLARRCLHPRADAANARLRPPIEILNTRCSHLVLVASPHGEPPPETHVKARCYGKATRAQDGLAVRGIADGLPGQWQSGGSQASSKAATVRRDGQQPRVVDAPVESLSEACRVRVGPASRRPSCRRPSAPSACSWLGRSPPRACEHGGGPEARARGLEFWRIRLASGSSASRTSLADAERHRSCRRAPSRPRGPCKRFRS